MIHVWLMTICKGKYIRLVFGDFLINFRDSFGAFLKSWLPFMILAGIYYFINYST